MTPIDKMKMRKMIKGMEFFSMEVAKSEPGLGLISERSKQIVANELLYHFVDLARKIADVGNNK
jgi:hypothetical protein